MAQSESQSAKGEGFLFNTEGPYYTESPETNSGSGGPAAFKMEVPGVPDARQRKNVTIGGSGIGDQPAALKDDQLGFVPYCEAIFTFLTHPNTRAPFTLSIEGEWGSGKSSMMLQLEEVLKSKGQKTIRFNAWRHDKVESMWTAFALNFILQLAASRVWYKRIWAHLKLNWSRFDVRKGWLSVLGTILLLLVYVLLLVRLWPLLNPQTLKSFLNSKNELQLVNLYGTLGWVGMGLGAVFLFQRVAHIIGNPFTRDLKKFMQAPDYQSRSAFIEEFHEDFDRAVRGLSQPGEKIFVFIDDLDRADVPRAVELMQGMNMMISSSDRLIFIIGMDREKIAAGVAAKYKDLLPFLNPKQSSLKTELGLTQALEFGYAFVEKFIQLSFRVPQPSIRSIRSFLASLGPQDQNKETRETSTDVNFNPVLLVAEGQDSEEFKTIIEACAPFFDYNPRRLKQFINTFRLKAHICHSTGLFNTPEPGFEDLTIPRLGKFVAIILKWPQITEDLIENPRLFDVITHDSKLEEGSKEHWWKQNATFMKLLELSPASQQQQALAPPEELAVNKEKYAITGIDVLALLRTSPSVSHTRLASPQQPESFTGSQYDASPGLEGNPPETAQDAIPPQAKRRKASVRPAKR